MSDLFTGPVGALVLLVLALGGVAVGLWLWIGFSSGRDASVDPPPLVFPTRSGGAGAGDHAPRRPFEFRPVDRREPPAANPPVLTPPPEGRGAASPATRAAHEPLLDGTLQLLPGHFEVVGGPGAGEEIRFVRLPGSPAEITFGRAEGPVHRHVRLESPTVSRQQARMAYSKGSWTLRNESSTNPTSLNGRPLASEIDVVPLRDGDRVEMGEISLLFHCRETRDRLPHRSSWHTDLGRRPTNQDAVIVKSLPDGRELAAVCDGMGSHHAGGEASHLALEVLVAALSEGTGLVDAVKRANTRVLAWARQGPDRDGIGTTLVALLRHGSTYQIANVGDSRAYRVVAGRIQQLTEDHSFVTEATREGRMSREEASRSPWRNAVTRNLGAGEEVEVDLFAGFDAEEDHRVVLCTDGVHGVLAEEEIAEVCRETPDIRDLARALVERSLVRGGDDNVSVAAVAFGADRSGFTSSGAVG